MSTDPIRWSVEQRVAFAASRLFWDGALNREDIVRRFGVSPTQATADLTRLRASLGSAMSYDVSRRVYVPGEGLSDQGADAGRILGDLRLVAEGVLPASASLLSTPPPVEIAGALARAVDPRVLRDVLWAIRDAQALAADYVSFHRPDSGQRILSPHALVFDGFRWHARAHDAEDGRFKDFLLSRLSSTTLDGPTRQPAMADEAWSRSVSMVIVPHPGLTPHQALVVARDYGMHQGRLEITVREATLFYARKRLGLVDGHESRPAHEQHIILAQTTNQA